MGNSICSNIFSRHSNVRVNDNRRTRRREININDSSRPSVQDVAQINILSPRQLNLSAIFGQYPQTMVYVEPCIKKPLSDLTEEEQIRLCIRLGFIDEMQTAIYDDSKRDKFNECAICMEDYMEGEKLRVLPCLHAYHQKCVDDWLQRSFTCPSCQQDMFYYCNNDSKVQHAVLSHKLTAAPLSTMSQHMHNNASSPNSGTGQSSQATSNDVNHPNELASNPKISTRSFFENVSTISGTTSSANTNKNLSPISRPPSFNSHCHGIKRQKSAGEIWTNHRHNTNNNSCTITTGTIHSSHRNRDFKFVKRSASSLDSSK